VIESLEVTLERTPRVNPTRALLRALHRPLAALALLLLWMNVELQALGALPALDARLLGARLLLCYVAVFWLRLAWTALTARRSSPPRGTCGRVQALDAGRSSACTGPTLPA
jgi:hypothetical protein